MLGKRACARSSNTASRLSRTDLRTDHIRLSSYTRREYYGSAAQALRVALSRGYTVWAACCVPGQERVQYNVVYDDNTGRLVGPDLQSLTAVLNDPLRPVVWLLPPHAGEED